MGENTLKQKIFSSYQPRQLECVAQRRRGRTHVTENVCTCAANVAEQLSAPPVSCRVNFRFAVQTFEATKLTDPGWITGNQKTYSTVL
jgi:hypothetical protein